MLTMYVQGVSTRKVATILDQLFHHATALNIKGESYRLKEKRRSGLLGQVKLVVEEAKEEDLEV